MLEVSAIVVIVFFCMLFFR